MHKSSPTNRLEQLVQLHKMCLQELDQLQMNLQSYLQTSTAMMDTLTLNWPEVGQNALTLTIYDNFLTSITKVMNLSRKFNIQLQLNHPQNEDKIHIFNMFRGGCKRREDEEMPQTKEGRRYDDRLVKKQMYNSFMESKRIDLVANNSKSLYPAEEIAQSSNNATEEEFFYPQLNLNDIYKIGDRIEAFVTYVKDVEELKFYVFDFQSEFMDTMNEVAESLDSRQYNSLPPAHEVFGVVLDKRILRAVRSPKVLYDQELEEEVWPCYLLDFGEVVHLKMNDIKYKLTERQRQVPGLAILCELSGTGDTMLQRKLKEMEYEKCCLKVVEIKKYSLTVDLVQNTQANNKLSNCNRTNISVKANEETKGSTNPFRQSSSKQLTEDELEMLHEEPAMCTSNAMTAVLGYSPQDEKRICRFYDPETGTCFKGTNCRQEHIPLHPEGWTKDVLPAVSFVDNRTPTIVYPRGSIINITPTYIGQLDTFYAQLNDPHHNNNPLIWNDEDVPAWKRLQKPPHIFELVLARYDDGLWYRAKILAHDDDYKMFKVFYVDYGNHQMIHLRSLAKCDPGMAHIPFQATLCRMAGVRSGNVTAEKRKHGLEKLCEAILNQSIEVKVVNHYEDLIITFIDELHLALIDWLKHEGYLKILV